MRFIIPPIPGVRRMNLRCWCRTERSVCADSAKTVPGNCRFLPAAGRLLLSPGGSDNQKQRLTREARHDGRLARVLTPVYVH